MIKYRFVLIRSGVKGLLITVQAVRDLCEFVAFRRCIPVIIPALPYRADQRYRRLECRRRNAAGVLIDIHRCSPYGVIRDASLFIHKYSKMVCSRRDRERDIAAVAGSVFAQGIFPSIVKRHFISAVRDRNIFRQFMKFKCPAVDPASSVFKFRIRVSRIPVSDGITVPVTVRKFQPCKIPCQRRRVESAAGSRVIRRVIQRSVLIPDIHRSCL